MKRSPASSQIEIPSTGTTIHGILSIPPNARLIVIFAHGSGSTNLNPRNRLVARSLLDRGFAVLLPDLSDDVDDGTDSPQARGYVSRIASRLTDIIDWLAENPATRGLQIGLFGGRTGAAAVMVAAALRPQSVRAVISRGGRPDLAEDLLHQVQAPTLMIVGSNDQDHIAHNRKAGEKLHGRSMLELIQGANHLFGEPGKLEQVASISCLWFQRNLALCG